MLIQEPDEQVLKWIEISCNYLAFLHRSFHPKKLKSYKTLDSKTNKNQ